MKFVLALAFIPAILAVAVPAPAAGSEDLKKREHCPSTSVINSCWGECKRAGKATDKCYNCCYYTCRPC